MRLLDIPDYLYDNYEKHKSLRKCKKAIKKFCKKQGFSEDSYKLFIYVQPIINDRFFKKENYKSSSLSHEEFNRERFYRNLTIRAFKLNDEFIDNMVRENFHSVTALSRQILETMIAVQYCCLNPKYIHILMRGEKGKYEDFDSMIKELKANYKPKDKDQPNPFIDFEREYHLFSQKFHVTPQTFEENTWRLKTDGQGNSTSSIYKKEDSLEKSTIMTFDNFEFFHHDLLELMNIRFFNCIHLIISGLGILRQSKNNSLTSQNS